MVHCCRELLGLVTCYVLLGGKQEVPFLHYPSALYAYSHTHLDVPVLLLVRSFHRPDIGDLRQKASKQTTTRTKKDKSLLFWRFSFYLRLSETQGVPQTIALNLSSRQQTAAKGQQLGQDRAEKLPEAVLSVKVTINCPTSLSLESELQQDLVPKLILIPSVILLL